MMRTDLPRPDEILEELADKTATQIQRLAPVAFDSALREMTRYHRFLLALGASRTPDGAVFNFAEVAGNAWQAPHKEWIRQYRRLFERAADRLADDSHFINSLAYMPNRLLPDQGDPELSPSVVCAILDLGPILVSRLEAWVTKRTTVETREGQSAEPRLALAGSDVKAYADVLPNIVGAWERLLGHPPSMYGWSCDSRLSHAECWETYRSSWAFLWQHLMNTGYCLAIAVWNEDAIGAALFRDALARWLQALDHRLTNYVGVRDARLLFPSILQFDWASANAAAAPLCYDYMPTPSPSQLFACIVSYAHCDVVLLTASLLLSWTMNGKQASKIGADVAGTLLRREVSEDDEPHRDRQADRFQSLFLDLLRYDLADGHLRDGSYTAKFDHVVTTLDNMTERRVVPGRIFTPSTMHGRDNLLLSDLAILLAYTPKEGDDGVRQKIIALSHREEVLPKGDRSLRDILRRLERFESALERCWPELRQGISLLVGDGDHEQARERLREIVSAAIATIKTARRKRLEARAPDPAKLERIRMAIETALLTQAPKVPFFRGVEVGRATGEQVAEWRDMRFAGIEKAQLLEPPMESLGSKFEETFVDGSCEMAGNVTWKAFCHRPRIKRKVSDGAEHEVFWSQISPLVAQIGPDPVLVVSNNNEGHALRHLVYASATNRPKMTIEQRRQNGGRDFYIATIEGVDVFGAELPAGEAWLFSAESLRAVRYAKTDIAGRYAELTFELGAELKGTLRVRVRQELEWSDSLIFELTVTGPGDSDGE